MSDSALLAETKSKNVWRKRAEDAEARAETLEKQLEAARSKLAKIADMAERASMVQDRSVGIIKQTCKVIADEAKP